MIERFRYFWWYTFVFFLPWQTVWIVREVFVGGEKWQYATVGIYASDVALMLCAALLVVRAPRDLWRKMRGDVFACLFMALFAWTFLSVLWATEKNMALLSTWRVFLMTLAYLCARYGVMSFRKTLAVFLASMTFQAMLALGQWTMQFVFSSSLFGIAEHDSAQWGTFVLKTESGRFLRAYGGFEHPNVLGGALVFAILFGVWLSATTKNALMKRGFLGMTAVSVFALVLTFSRSAWLGFFMGSSVLLFATVKCCFHENDGRVKKRSRFSGAVFLALTSFFVGFFLVRDIALSRFSEETLAREGSISDRTVYMRQAGVAIKESLFFGVGGGNFTAFSRLRFPSEGRFIGDFQPVHAVPILVFAELGVVGSFLFTLLFVFGFIRVWEKRSICAGVIFFALLPLLALDHWLWSGHFGAVFLGLLFGLCAMCLGGKTRDIPIVARNGKCVYYKPVNP